MKKDCCNLLVVMMFVCVLFMGVSGQGLLPQYRLVGLMPYTNLLTGEPEFVGRSRSLGYFAAITDVNNDPTFPFILEDYIIDTKRDVDTAVNSGLLVVSDTVGWVGPHRSTVTIGFHDAVSEPFNSPLISGASTSISLTPSAVFPLMTRTFPSDFTTAIAINAILDKFCVSNEAVTLISRTGDTAAEGLRLNLLALSAASDNWEITQDLNNVTSGMTDAEVIDLMATVRDSGNSIVLVSVYDNDFTSRAMKYGYQAGISGIAGYQWILDNLAKSEDAFFVDGVLDEEAVLGWEGNIVVLSAEGSGDVYDRMLVGYQRERLLMPLRGYDLDTFLEEPAGKTAHHYDAVYAHAHAIKAMLEDGKDPLTDNLIDYIREVEFQGAIGAISWSDGSNDLSGSVQLDIWLAVRGEQIIRGGYETELVTDFIWKGQETFPLGALFSDADSADRSRSLALQACVTDHNNDNWSIVGTFLYSLEFGDTNGDPDTAADAAEALLTTPKVSLLGTSTQEETDSVHAVAEDDKVPLVSGASNAMKFSDEDDYPYFARTFPSSFNVASGVAALLNNNAEDGEISILFTPSNPQSVALKDALVDLSDGESWDVEQIIEVDEDITDFSVILNQIRDAEIRIVVAFLLNPASVARMFAQSYDEEMSGDGNGYQWIVDDASVSLDSYRINGVLSTSAVRGWRTGVGFLAGAIEGTQNNRFLTSYAREQAAQADPSLFPEVPDNTAAFHYDLCAVLTRALELMVEDGDDPFDGEKMMEKIRQVEGVEGASGTLAFNGNDRGGVYALLMQQGDGIGSFLDVGQWDGETLREEGFLWAANVGQQVFQIASLLPLDTPAGRSAYLAILAAVNDIASNEESKIIFELDTIDTNDNNFGEIVEKMEDLVEKGIVGFLGGESASLVEELHEEVLDPREMPLLSAAAVAGSLEEPFDYPFFLRDIPSTSPESQAIAALLTKYVTDEYICLIYRPKEDNSESLRDAVQSLEVTGDNDDEDEEGDGWQISKEWTVNDLDDFKDINGFGKCEVVLSFLYDAELTGRVLGQAEKDGTAGKGSEVQWIVDDFSFSVAAIDGDDSEKGWEGAVGFSADPDGGSIYETFLASYARERANQDDPEDYPETPEPKAAYHYDLVYVYLAGLGVTFNPFGGRGFMIDLRGVFLEGATGDISFQQNDRQQDIPFLFLGGDGDGNFEDFGSYTVTAGLDENGDFLWRGIEVESTSSSPPSLSSPSLSMWLGLLVGWVMMMRMR